MPTPKTEETNNTAPSFHERQLGIPSVILLILAGVLGYSTLHLTNETDMLRRELQVEQTRNETTGSTIDRLRNFNGR